MCSSDLIQSVNSLFGEINQQVKDSLNLSLRSIPADKALVDKYQLGKTVSYEGGWNINQNKVNAATEAYTVNFVGGFSLPIPACGYYANQDPRNLPLAQAAINQFYSSVDNKGLMILYQAFDNRNSWGIVNVADPRLQVQ